MTEEIHFKLKIADIPSKQLEDVMEAALIQNCISGIRGGAIFGLMTNANVETLTVDVYTSFSGLDETAQHRHVEELTRHIEQQWDYLHSHLPEKHALKMAPPPRQYSPAKDSVFGHYQWEQLLRDLASWMRHNDPVKFLENGMLRMEGMNMQLHYRQQRPAMFELRTDLGPMPRDADIPSTRKALLIHNHEQGQQTGVWWGLHPDTDHVIMVQDHALSCDAGVFTPPRAPDLFDLLKTTAVYSARFWESVLRCKDENEMRPSVQPHNRPTRQHGWARNTSPITKKGFTK